VLIYVLSLLPFSAAIISQNGSVALTGGAP
jgi:hypothetical protein